MDEQQKEYKVELLSYVPSKFSLTIGRIMEAPLAKEKLTKAIQILAKGKNPSPDWLMAEFFQSY